MTGMGARSECPECGARLRQGREPGALCDPCQRNGPQLKLPPAFYDRPPLDAALGESDFGPVFLAIRAEKRWTQQTLGDYLDLEQKVISEIERGKRFMRDVRVVSRVATRCGIPPVKLGFGEVTVDGATITGRKGGWMDRRDFVQRVAALALGASTTGLDIDRLTAMLPPDEPVGSRRIGVSDIDAIEDASATFMSQDFARGSGWSRDAAVAQLRSVLPLLGAPLSPELRPRLHVAIAELALMAGYMSFEVRQHESARRLWTIGLDVARRADDARGSDLAVYLLYDLTLQAVHLGDPEEALRLAQLGHAAAVGPHPVSAATMCCLVNAQARAHAIRGDAAACARALGRAREHCDGLDPAATPRWVGHVSEAGMSGYQGTANYTLAVAKHDSHAASRAVQLLRDGVDHFGPAYARLRALYLPDLSGSHALSGDVSTAVEMGHQAIEAVSAVSSPRVHDRLRMLHTTLEPMRTSSGVSELRQRLVATSA
jgi:transcriptional regulator with XRE-family HTH domain